MIIQVLRNQFAGKEQSLFDRNLDGDKRVYSYFFFFIKTDLLCQTSPCVFSGFKTEPSHNRGRVYHKIQIHNKHCCFILTEQRCRNSGQCCYILSLQLSATWENFATITGNKEVNPLMSFIRNIINTLLKYFPWLWENISVRLTSSHITYFCRLWQQRQSSAHSVKYSHSDKLNK